MRIYLWEYAVSPHLGNILSGMAALGYDTYYVVHSETYSVRQAEGWVLPDLPGVKILQPRSSSQMHNIIASASPEDIHICAGLRGSDHVRLATAALRAAGRRFIVFMETIDERSPLSFLKRPLYKKLFFQNRLQLEGILAAGADTPAWVAARGVPSSKIFSFAYFLNAPRAVKRRSRPLTGVRLLFVGNLIARKRVRLIIEALRSLPNDVTLDIVGDGPLRARLAELGEAYAPGRVIFHGTRPMPEIASFMASADCLVLPSDHDGWGAVISEAMLAGTPVVCSDRCGASVIVRASGCGKVFQAFARNTCAEALKTQVSAGPIFNQERAALSSWSKCLAAPEGSLYLDRIVKHLRCGGQRPIPPWAKAGRLDSKLKSKALT
ncbi:glycosyltransferase family 4 protein (plasmid) [Sulfitobacter sp. W027]|uniref:glycosyltransferase family 4 protein n=1 Tax=Sulfitobacter sp. W027 TaxID=2867025 RepID=UPI0021A3A743|nr:glycosyltransferase [Sulfitobacter sp. W027]UWR35729.1 glycosyltransferase family 4 protein [Sulfitobacter sp. W027]